ncbi:MAG: hypothetical protein ACLP01_20910 [Solirubrobacteraceae bacterium]
MSDWWVGIAPAQVTVACGVEQHRLRWEGGALRALDHADLEGERTLAALGGEPCACVELLDAWDRHRDDPRVLALASRGPADRLAPQGEEQGPYGTAGRQVLGPRSSNVARLSSSGASTAGPRVLGPRSSNVARLSSSGAGFVGRTAALGVQSVRGRALAGPQAGRTKQERMEEELIALLGLGGGLPERLQASVTATWRQRIASRERGVARVRPQLHAALYGRVLATVGAWLGGSGQRVRLTMIGERGRTRVTEEDGAVAAELPFGWLADVWCRDLALVGGRLCLAAATEDGGRTWSLTTVAPDLGRSAVVTLALPEQ